MKQKIYIAGKVTGLHRNVVEKNFNTLKDYFTQKGFEVISPIDIVIDHKTMWKNAMKICITALMDCDFIYPMRNSWDSKGALIEIEIAKAFDILCLETIDIDESSVCIDIQKQEIKNRSVIISAENTVTYWGGRVDYSTIKK